MGVTNNSWAVVNLRPEVPTTPSNDSSLPSFPPSSFISSFISLIPAVLLGSITVFVFMSTVFLLLKELSPKELSSLPSLADTTERIIKMDANICKIFILVIVYQLTWGIKMEEMTVCNVELLFSVHRYQWIGQPEGKDGSWGTSNG